MLKTTDITEIDVEASSYCNARCPQCSRNFYGWNEPIAFPHKHIDVSVLEEIVVGLPNLTHINYCGNYGDPMMHPDIVHLSSLADKIDISTNGSIGNKETWEKLGKMKNVQVEFSIDGMEDTNHIYRQDVSWKKIMERAKWYINSGGRAIWVFIIFKHNHHQIEESKKLARDMGFANFMVKHHGRDNGLILDNDGREVGFLEPYNRPYEDVDKELELALIKKPFILDTDYDQYEINCQSLSRKWIYVDVLGQVKPCCYLGSFYEKGILRGETLQDKLDNFHTVSSRWNTKSCHEECALQCGNKIDLS